MTANDPSADDLRTGQLIELEIGPIAHGGHCVARYLGRVVFVRLALPGERAVVRLTEVRPNSFCRGEVVEVLQSHPDRIEPPCGHFHPGGCGGCDLQHVAPPRQRRLKAEVVGEQLRRLAGVDVAVEVEALPGDGFGWRTRVRWALDQQGRIGPRAVRSHRVMPISAADPCLIAADGLTELAAVADPPPDVLRQVAAQQPRTRPRAGRAGRHRSAELPEVVLVRAENGETRAIWPDQVAEPIIEHAVGRRFSVAGDGFWQVHPAAAQTLADAVREALSGSDLTGGSGWDLYGGVGLFAEVLAAAVGAGGEVITVEGDRAASELSAQNLTHRPWVRAVHSSVEAAVADLPLRVDAVVLDPPRSGAGPALCAAIAAHHPAVVVYVACDPAALGRDTGALQAAGYRLAGLRAFDCFPQTHHVECVARYLPA